MSNLGQEVKQIQKIDADIKDIATKCEKAIAIIEKALLSKQNPKLSNQDTMDIYKFFQIFYNLQLVRYIQQWKMSKTLLKQIGPQFKVEDQIYELFLKYINRYLDKMNTFLSTQSEDPESVLENFLEQYQNFKVYVRWLGLVFSYLDRFYTKKKDTNLYTVAFKRMKEIYFDRWRHLFLKTAFYFFNKVRQYQLQPPKNISKLIQLFMDIDCNKITLKKNQMEELVWLNEITERLGVNKYYQEYFEAPYLKELESFYQSQCSQWMQLTSPEYVQKATQALQLEQNLYEEFYPKSRKPVRNKLEMILIKEVGQAIIDKQGSGVNTMLNYERHQQLNELYSLLKRVPEMLPLISKRLIDYLEGIGNSINMTEVDQKKQEQTAGTQARPLNIAEVYIDKILDLMDRSDNLVVNVFENEMEMQKAYKTAFSSILNKNEKSPLYLAIYCDLFFKNDKIATDIEFQKRMNTIIKVFQYIYQRDVFFKHYQKLMSNRLLGGQYKNRDSEKQLIQKFKGEAGTNAITNIQTMLNDVNLSEEFNSSNKNDLQQKFDFKAQMLTHGCWPLTNIADQINPPSSMQSVLKYTFILKQQSQYEQLYLNKYSGRQVLWCFNHGTGEVVLKTTKERYFLVLSTIQIIAFLQFNQDEMMCVSEIIRRTNIPKNELEGALIPFVVFKIIKRQRADLDEFDDNEYLTLQMDFQNKSKKLRILPNPKMVPKRQQEQKLLSAEETQQMEQIIKEREFIVDSQLVRVMKSRKQLKHNELVQDCSKMINLFKPDVNFIKKRIESLIEREYLRRDEVDWNTYSYVN